MVPSNRTQNVTKGDRLQFKCEVTAGKPKPKIVWKNPDGEVIDAANDDRLTIIDDVLTIDPVQPDDRGKWTCEATNVAGQDSLDFIIDYVYGT